MKKIITLFLLCLVAITASAQKKDKEKLALDSVSVVNKTLMNSKEIGQTRRFSVYPTAGPKELCDSLRAWICDRLGDTAHQHAADIPSIIGKGGSTSVPYNEEDFNKYVNGRTKALRSIRVSCIYEDNDYVTLAYTDISQDGDSAPEVSKGDYATFSKTDGRRMGWELLKGLTEEKVVERIKKSLNDEKEEDAELRLAAPFMADEGVRVAYSLNDSLAETRTHLVRKIADTFSIDGVRYAITSRKNKRCEVTTQSGNGPKGDVTIPKSVKSGGITYSVTRIAEGAFSGCKELRSVSITKNVKVIEPEAFAACPALTKVVLPASLKTIPEKAFRHCSALREVIIPEGVRRIDSQAFSECSALENVVLPSSLDRIGSSAFSQCTALKEIIIPEDVNEVDFLAFEACSALHTVTLLGSDTEVNFCAFEDCNAVKSIYNMALEPQDISQGTFPETAVIYVLPGCREEYRSEANWRGSDIVEVSTINAHGMVYTITSGEEKTCMLTSLGSNYSASVHIPETISFCGLQFAVTEVTPRACAGKTRLQSIEFPTCVSRIGASAFEGCTALHTVAIPSDTLQLGDYAFRDCSGLKTAIFSDALTTLSRGAFQGCVLLQHIDLPASLREMNDSLFAGCISLQSVDLPESATNFGTYVFADCANLKTLKLPAELSILREGTFSGCMGLTSIKLPEGLHSIESRAFKGCALLPQITIPSTVALIGEEAFANCPLLMSVTNLSATPQLIESNVFDRFGQLHVAPENAKLYKKTKVWRKFSIKKDVVVSAQTAAPAPSATDAAKAQAPNPAQ